PTIFGSSPIAPIAFSSPAESLRYEDRNRMSGLIARSSRTIGAKSVVASGYLISDTIWNPCLLAWAFAPATGPFKNGASEARIAIDFGFGDWLAERSKKPSL